MIMTKYKIVVTVLFFFQVHSAYGDLLRSFPLPSCDRGKWASDCNDPSSFNLKYRTFDGKCTNLLHRDWGSNNRPFIRLLEADYEGDLLQSPAKNYTFDGSLFHTEELDVDDIESDFLIRNTAMLGHFGQFVAHDISHAFQETFNCNELESVSCRDNRTRVQAEFLSINGHFTLARTRSCERNGSREQVNIATAFLDASTVYGSYYLLGEKFLRGKNGLLKVNNQFSSPGKLPYLPFMDKRLPKGYNQCVESQFGNKTISCFMAGDFRANQHLMLTALHTVFFREHNRIARKLKKMNRHWKPNTIFHETRKIIGAIIQHITYDMYLPEVLGPSGMRQIGAYYGYSEGTNAGVATEVATAALRFGHTLIPPVLRRYNVNYDPGALEDIPITETFFAPDKLILDGGIDSLIRGAVVSSLRGEYVDKEMTLMLSPNFRNAGLDLNSIDIARGKDHGLWPYKAYRAYCGLKPIKTVEQFGNLTKAGVDPKLIAHLFDNIAIFNYH